MVIGKGSKNAKSWWIILISIRFHRIGFGTNSSLVKAHMEKCSAPGMFSGKWTSLWRWIRFVKRLDRATRSKHCLTLSFVKSTRWDSYVDMPILFNFWTCFATKKIAARSTWCLSTVKEATFASFIGSDSAKACRSTWSSTSHISCSRPQSSCICAAISIGISSQPILS